MSQVSRLKRDSAPGKLLRAQNLTPVSCDLLYFWLGYMRSRMCYLHEGESNPNAH
jgi:hypothetical protein